MRTRPPRIVAWVVARVAGLARAAALGGRLLLVCLPTLALPPALAATLAACLLVAAPTAALADDDDDDDDGGGGSGGGGGGGGRSVGGGGGGGAALLPNRIRLPGAERPRQRTRQQRPRRAERRRPARVAPAPAQRRQRPEFVAYVEIGQPLDAVTSAGFEVLDRARLAFVGQDMIRVRSTRRESAAAALRRLRGLLPGRQVDRNAVYRTAELGCGLRDCPAFELIGWPAPPRSCPSAPTIGLIDTGVAAEHPAFAPGSVTALTSRSADRRPSRPDHGTAVAALLVGRAEGPYPGLLPNARLVAVDAFHRAGGEDTADGFALVKAIDLLVARGVKVINLSLAGPDNAVVRLAVEAAAHQGHVLVAAAGNGGRRAAPAYPAAYETVIAVTAVDRDRRLFRRANRGDYVDLAAPGVDVVTAGADGRARKQSGTSFASPFVAAALAAAGLEADADWRAAARILAGRTDDLGRAGRDADFGEGLLRAAGLCPAAGGS
jgi:hypothetical protein